MLVDYDSLLNEISTVLSNCRLAAHQVTHHITNICRIYRYTSRRQRLACLGPLEWLGYGIRISRQVY